MELREEALGPRAVAEADVKTRADFIVRTYNHLLGAIAAFTAIEVVLFKTGAAETIARSLMGVSWLIVLGAFVLVGWMASHVAHRVASRPLQYAALAAFVAAEAVIFVPLLFIANLQFPGAIESAVWVTAAGFLGLTGIAFITRKDFSFLGGLLKWGGFCILGAIVFGAIFGFQLGTFFMVGLVAFAGASILYDTSNVIHHYPEDRHVAASLELFGSVMLMLWYVLRLFMSSRD
jgi:hypothetical protein